MHPNADSNMSVTRRAIALAVLAGVGLILAACNGGSVVSNNGGQTATASPSPEAPAVAANAPAAAASPLLPPGAVPTMPVGPIGQTTPTAQGTPFETKDIRNGIPVTVSPAKPMLTPPPDPFPARPTPTVVLTDGKVVQQWPAPAEAAKQANPMKSNADSAKLGRELYMQKCVDCHGKEGKGNGWMGKDLKREGKPLPPTNLASKMVQANSDGELFWKITKGRSPMPAHGVRFEDEQRWHIVSFLRTFKE